MVSSLLFLWDLSLALCLIGAAALLLLMAARFVAARSGKARAEARQELLPQLLGTSEPLFRLRGLDLEVAAALTSELAELTRGEDRQQVLARATELGVADLLIRRLHARTAQTRLSAVETLALFGEYGELARSALDDRNSDVRLGAALAIAQREDAPQPAELVEKLRIGREEHSLLLVSMMADLAGRNPAAVAALLFDKDMPYEAKVAATDALSACGGEYAPMLAQMAVKATGEPDLQPRIYRALGKAGHPVGIDAIGDGLASPEWPVRAAAAEAAGKTGALELCEELGGMLDDVNWWVRFRAGEALLKMGSRGILVLERAASGTGEYARAAARALLSEGRVA